MKKIVLVVVTLFIGIVIGYLYRDCTTKKDCKVVEISTAKEKAGRYTSFVSDSDAWMEEAIWNEFGPV